jgi:hypothetical protein
MFTLCLLALQGVYAQDWEVKNTAPEQNMILTDIEGTDNHTAQVIASHELNASEVSLISTCLNAIWAIPGLTGTHASVRVSDDGVLRIIAYPESMKYLESEIAPNLPGGLGFYYNTTLFYDITLKVEKYITKITGLYVTPEDLLKRIALARLMPDRFLYDDEILNRVGNLEKAMMALLKVKPVTKKIDPELVIAIISLYNENPSILAKDAVIRLKAAGMTASVKDVNAVLQVMVGKF